MDDDEPSRQELMARVTQLEDELFQLRRAYNAIVNSTSWRLARPMQRFLARNAKLRAWASDAARYLMRAPLRSATRPPVIAAAAPAPGLGAALAGAGARLSHGARDAATGTGAFARRGLRKAARLTRAGVAASPAPVRAAFARIEGPASRVYDAVLRRLPAPAASPPPPTANIDPLQPKPEFASVQRFTGRYIFFEFEWEKTVRPVDIGESDDGRALAAGFVDLALRPADPENVSQVLTRIDFRAGGNSLRYVCYGFSFVEPWGTWTNGGRSSALVWVPTDCPDQCQIVIQAGVYKAGLEAAAAKVYANSTPIGDIRFDGSGLVTLPVDVAQVTTQVQSGALNLSLDEHGEPDISIIMLNYNKPGITLASVLSILSAKTAKSYEIIVLDNGSAAENVSQLRGMKLPVRLVRLRANRFFGEGNNIAAEHARAPVLLFLNNDAFLKDEVLDKLQDALLSADDVGAVGPVFRYPDGTLQEAGAYLSSDGSARQRGKFNQDFKLEDIPAIDAVDYISAACVMIRRDDFFALGGFDLRYDPAYYEDSDLCLRLLGMGKRTLLVRDADVIHVENATTSDPANKGIASDIIERHKQIFMTRWGEWLASRKPEQLPHLEFFEPERLDESMASAATASTLNCVYSPFPLVPGGGERYLLGSALALNAERPTAVVTPDEYSGLRLNTLMRDLGFPAYELFPQAERQLAPSAVNYYMMMGNELLPTRQGYGAHRIYHCQFPFPAEMAPSSQAVYAKYLDRYQAVVVNSAFTRDAYARGLAEFGLAPKPIHIIAPPVRLLKRAGETPPPEKENIILSIGRFTPAGHAKRQDVIVQAFANLAREPRMKGWRLVLCGVVPNDPTATAYFKKLAEAAEDAGAEIILAPSRQQLEDLLWRAKVYVSATGFGVRDPKEAWKCEHFGITVVEAASAGCVPVVYDMGGPVEICETLGAGMTFASAAELAMGIVSAAEAAEDRALREQIILNARGYSEAAFFKAWSDVLAEVAV